MSSDVPSGRCLVGPPAVRVILVRHREQPGIRHRDNIPAGVVAEDREIAARLDRLRLAAQRHVDLELGHVPVRIGHLSQVASRVVDVGCGVAQWVGHLRPSIERVVHVLCAESQWCRDIDLPAQRIVAIRRNEAKRILHLGQPAVAIVRVVRLEVTEVLGRLQEAGCVVRPGRGRPVERGDGDQVTLRIIRVVRGIAPEIDRLD